MTAAQGQGVHWLWTWNAPDEETGAKWSAATAEDPPVVMFDAGHMVYFVYQVEKAPTTGQIHLQGYVALNKRHRFNKVKDLLGDDTIHLTRVTTTPDLAAAYCKKPETRVAGPWEWGKAPDKRGKRSPLEDAIKDIKSGKPMAQVACAHAAVWVHSNRGLKDLRAQMNKPTVDYKPTHVTVLWGPTRTGKTRSAMGNLCVDGRLPFKMPLSSGFWFDGYDGEDTLVIDDFYGQVKFSDMLQLLDDHVVQVPVKGGFVWGAWTKVYITSNSHPDEWWKGARESIPAASMEAMMARLKEIKLMDGSAPAAVSPSAPVLSPSPDVRLRDDDDTDVDTQSLLALAAAVPSPPSEPAGLPAVASAAATTTTPSSPPWEPQPTTYVNPRGDFTPLKFAHFFNKRT